MKKIFACILVMSLLVTFAGLAFGAEKKKVVKEVVVPTMSDQERTALEAKAIEQLNVQVWTIYLIAQGVKKPRVETDVLTFSGGSVVSQNLSAKGYGGSNYSLTGQDDGTAIFETVQRAQDESIALWRGTLSGTKLNGILNIRPNKGSAVIYSFSTSMPAVAVEPETVEAGKKKR